MKALYYLIAALAACATQASLAAYSQTLTTAHYVVVISNHCAEGTVVCDHVTYLGTSRRTGKSITLSGKDMTHYCPSDQGDGASKTPCHHLGFIFRNDDVIYRVWDRGVLEVWQQARPSKNGSTARKLLLRETGSWSY